jgi:hypothetical protein
MRFGGRIMNFVLFKRYGGRLESVYMLSISSVLYS